MQSIVLLFPGQGSQKPGMAHDLAEAFAPARAALGKWFLRAADSDPVRAAHLRKAHFARLAL